MLFSFLVLWSFYRCSLFSNNPLHYRLMICRMFTNVNMRLRCYRSSGRWWLLLKGFHCFYDDDPLTLLSIIVSFELCLLNNMDATGGFPCSIGTTTQTNTYVLWIMILTFWFSFCHWWSKVIAADCCSSSFVRRTYKLINDRFGGWYLYGHIVGRCS